MAKTPLASPTPEEIVEKWRNRVVSRLKPWFLARDCFTFFEPKLHAKIKGLLEGGAVFKKDDMKNSLRVAGDAARICKILQPKGPKKIKKDTFQRVLDLCAKEHRVCRSGGGAGGWCDLSGG
jgi:hypothetical protein